MRVVFLGSAAAWVIVAVSTNMKLATVVALGVLIFCWPTAEDPGEELVVLRRETPKKTWF